jgi:hypothetical protein
LGRWCCCAHTVIGNSRLDLRVPLLCNRGPPSTGCTPSCVSNYSPPPISHHGPFRRQHLRASRTGRWVRPRSPTKLSSPDGWPTDARPRTPLIRKTIGNHGRSTSINLAAAGAAGFLILTGETQVRARTTAPAMQQLSMRRGFCVRPWPATHPFAPAFRRVQRAGGQQPVSSSQFAPRRPLCCLAASARATTVLWSPTRSTRLSPCSTFSLPFLKASTPPLDLLGLVAAEVEDMRVAEITVRAGLRP